MTINDYLKHRKRYEVIAVTLFLLAIMATNATSLIIEDRQNSREPSWIVHWATEFTAVVVVPFLLPPLFLFLDWLSLSLANLRWRVLWHIPGFFTFSLAHIAAFSGLRYLLWTVAGQEFEVGPVLLNLVYELRKGFWAYLGIVAVIYSYRFILDRLQGEARFLTEQAADSTAHTFRNQFLVKMLDKEYLVRVDEVQWVQTASNYVLLHCGDRHYPMRQTLKKLSEQLDPQRFKRVHRTAIVNLDQVLALREKGELQLELRTGELVPVSKTYLPELRQALMQSSKLA